MALNHWSKTPTKLPMVAAAIKDWKAQEVFTVGDNSYGLSASTNVATWDSLDENIGQFFADWIYPLHPDSNVSSSGSPDKKNYFHVTIGNHCCRSGPTEFAMPLLTYLRGTHPNTTDGGRTMLRYYSWRPLVAGRPGPVEAFCLHSNSWEPDGISVGSRQALWLQQGLANSTAAHRVVFLHHAPYTSSTHAPNLELRRWPFQAWGASVVIFGHAHAYERLVDSSGFTFLCNGLGGSPLRYPMRPEGQVPESRAWFNSTNGWQKLEADEWTMNITFESLTQGYRGIYRDKVVLKAVGGHETPSPPTAAGPPRRGETAAFAPAVSGSGVVVIVSLLLLLMLFFE